MSRWIDADRLTRNLIGAIRLGEMVDVPTGELEAVLNDVLSAPSIDIVRCGECAKRKKNKFCLEHMRSERDDNGFCSYGEREGE